MPVDEEAKKEAQEGSMVVQYPRSAIPEPYQTMARRELRKIPTWKLKEAYEALGGGKATGIEVVEANRAYALSAITELLYERGALRGEDMGIEEARRIADGMELHHSPISAHCEDVLAHPPKCFDFAGIRSFVMCRAWDILEKEKRTKLPVSEAWREARKVCEK